MEIDCVHEPIPSHFKIGKVIILSTLKVSRYCTIDKTPNVSTTTVLADWEKEDYLKENPETL